LLFQKKKKEEEEEAKYCREQFQAFSSNMAKFMPMKVKQRVCPFLLPKNAINVHRK
jgi:hypothetical protein